MLQQIMRITQPCIRMTTRLRILSPDFTPAENDVICGHGRQAWDHPGNIAFRKLIQSKVCKYEAIKSKSGKSRIVSDIVNTVRAESLSGIGFVRHHYNGMWIRVQDCHAREKVGQMFRDILHSKYRSSTKSKGLQRKVAHVKMNEKMNELLRGKTVAPRISHAIREIKKGGTDQHIGTLLDQTNIDLLDTIKEFNSRQDRDLEPYPVEYIFGKKFHDTIADVHPSAV